MVLSNQNHLNIESIDFIDLSGKLIFSKQLNSDANLIKIPINPVAQGVYVAIVKANQMVSKTKLIID